MPDGLSINSHLSGIQGSVPSTEEKQRAMELAKSRLCPHCGEKISLADAISMVHGGGWERWVQVELENGRIVPLRVFDVNPQTMRIMEP